MKRSLFALAALVAAANCYAWGGPPDWVKELAAAKTMDVSAKDDGVVLLDDTTVTVRDDGEVRSLHRVAFRILRNGGRELAYFAVPFDNETRLSGLERRRHLSM